MRLIFVGILVFRLSVSCLLAKEVDTLIEGIEWGSTNIKIDDLVMHKEKLLDHFGSIQFFKIVFRQGVQDEDSFYEAFREAQAELLEYAWDAGAEIEDFYKKSTAGMGVVPLLFLDKCKDRLIKKFGASLFLKNVVKATDFLTQNEELGIQLAGEALLAGAEINYIDKEGNSILRYVNSMEMLKYLTEEGAVCKEREPVDFEEMHEGGLESTIINADYMVKQQYKNLGAIEEEEAKIPYIVHHIWLTNQTSPREIIFSNIENVIRTKELFEADKGDWEHIVWVNDPELIPNSVEMLESAGILVKSIFDYTGELKLLGLMENLIEDNRFGMASDVLRYSLVERFGGIYSDLNYRFNRSLYSEVHRYNYFGLKWRSIYPAPYLFASSARHPVNQRVLKIVERNFIHSPKYLSEMVFTDHTKFKEADYKTARPMYLAYFSEANKNGNIDVLYPAECGEENTFPWKVGKEWEITGNKYNISSYEEYFEASYHRPSFYKLKDELCMGVIRRLLQEIDERELCGDNDLEVGKDNADGSRLTWLD